MSLPHPLDIVSDATVGRILDELRRRGELKVDADEDGGARITFVCPHCGAPDAGVLVSRTSRWRCAACPAGGSAASIAITLGVDEWQIAETLRRREVEEIAGKLLAARVDPALAIVLCAAFDDARGGLLSGDDVRALVTRAAERELERRRRARPVRLVEARA